MRTILIMIAGLMLTANMAAAGDIYTWTDSKGTVHISQVPREGARKVGAKEERQEPPGGKQSSLV